MTSVIFTLFAILGLGFAAVGLVGFMGWRARMRREEMDFEDIFKAA